MNIYVLQLAKTMFLLHSWTKLIANWSLTYEWEVRGSALLRTWGLRENAFIAKMGVRENAFIATERVNINEMAKAYENL